MADTLTFCLLIPTLNEIDGMRVVMPQVDRSLFKEIIVVDGGSTDGTVQYCHENNLTIVQQPNKGVPDAEEYGVLNSTADVIITFTPDGNSLSELLPSLCRLFHEGYDMIIVSRYLATAKSDDDDVITALGNRIFTMAVNILFGGKLTDSLVGFRGYTRNAVKQMRLVSMGNEFCLREKFYLMNSWELGSSIRASRLNLKVHEIPGDEPARIGGVRKMSILRNGLGSVAQIVYDYLFFRHSRL